MSGLRELVQRDPIVSVATAVGMPRLPWTPKVSVIGADLLTVAAATILAFGVIGVSDPRSAVAVTLLSLPIWVVVMGRHHLYSARHVGSRLREAHALVEATTTTLLLLAAAGLLFDLPVSRHWLAWLFVLALTGLLAERELVRRGFTLLRRHGRLRRPVLVVGGNAEADELVHVLETTRSLGYRVSGRLREPRDEYAVLAATEAAGATGVVVATTALGHALTNRVVRLLVEHGIHVELTSSLRDIAAERLTVRPLGRFPLVYVEPARRSGWRGIAKRGFDLLGAAALLVLASPVLLIAVICVAVTSPGPVIFRQTRVGRHGNPFRVLKLRTMTADAEARLAELRDRNEADGPLFKIRDDPRITPVGRWLRASSIDELPQLVNVLRGEMSLVGPRPALPTEVASWSPDLHNRLLVRPGLTGMWQVNGRSSASFEDYTRLDLYYVDNWSLWTDLAIVARTVPAVILRRGAR